MSYIANCDSLFYLVRYLDVCIRFFFLTFSGTVNVSENIKVARIM